LFVTADPFEVLGIAPTFSLAVDVLEARQRELNRMLHPDRFVQAPHRERREALSRAIDVNEAHRALKDPVTRANALLRRLGHAETEAKVAPEFLGEIMELREQLSQHGRVKDKLAITDLVESVRGRKQLLEAALAIDFENALSGGDQPHAPLNQRVAELRYYARLLDEAHSLLDELD
jgi:molecular chaperone HscB